MAETSMLNLMWASPDWPAPYLTGAHFCLKFFFLTASASLYCMLLSFIYHLGCFCLQSIKYEQQAFTALILVYSLLDSMRELFVYMPARRCISLQIPKMQLQ